VKDTLQAEAGPSGTIEKISSTAVQMCATEMLPDDADLNSVDCIEIAGSAEIQADEKNLSPDDLSLTMSATEATTDAAGPNENDTSWKMSATCASSDDIVKESSEFPAHGSAPDPSCNLACSLDKNAAAIRFFIPDSLIPLWNYAFIRYLELAAGSGKPNESPSSADKAQNSSTSDNTGTEIPPKASTHPSHSDDSGDLLEGFLFSLIYHYLENEHKRLKKKKRRLRHKVIERDSFRCIVPGCSSRSGLDDHHITFRSQGGGDDLPNNASACFEHHRYCIHDNRYITIKGQAPDNLTIAMGVEPGRPPFAMFINGRRVDAGS
jgi:hypothetical protein